MMPSTELTVSANRAIQWPRWTDTFEVDSDYLGLTARILCGLYDGSCETCRCADPDKSYYAHSVRDLLPAIWPHGPLEMILQFNEFASMKNMPDKDKVRDPVSSAFAKLQEHAAFWTWVKSNLRNAGAGRPVEAQGTQCDGGLRVTGHAPSGLRDYACGGCALGDGAVGAPQPQPESTPEQPPIQGTSNMSSEIINPFADESSSQSPSISSEMTDEPGSHPPSTGTLLVVGGLGLLLIGGLIAADMYRTSKGIRPVVVSPPMMPMGVYY